MTGKSPATGGVSGSHAGILMMIAAVLCFSVMEASAKYLAQDYPVPMIAWARYIFHALFALAFFVDRRRIPQLRTRRPGLHIFRGIIMFAATMLFFGGISLLPLADATAVVFGAPLYVAALSALVLGERVGIARTSAVIVGFIGILVVIRPGPGFTNWAILLPVGAGLCYALFQLSTRILGRTDSVWSMFFYMPVVGSIAASFVVPYYCAVPDLQGIALMALAGMFGGIGQYFIIRAFTTTEASVVAPFVYTQIVWATLFGLMVFGQLPDVWTIAGTLIVISSGLFIWHRERRRAARPAVASGLPR